MTDINAIILATVQRAVQECLEASDTAIMPELRREAVTLAQAYATQRAYATDDDTIVIEHVTFHGPAVDAFVDATDLAAFFTGCDIVLTDDSATKTVTVSGPQQSMDAFTQLHDLFTGQLNALAERVSGVLIATRDDDPMLTYQIGEPNSPEDIAPIASAWMRFTREALGVDTAPVIAVATTPKEITSE